MSPLGGVDRLRVHEEGTTGPGRTSFGNARSARSPRRSRGVFAPPTAPHHPPLRPKRGDPAIESVSVASEHCLRPVLRPPPPPRSLASTLHHHRAERATMCARRSGAATPLSTVMTMTLLLVGVVIVCSNLPEAGASLSPEHLYALAVGLNASDDDTALNNKVDEPGADRAGSDRPSGGRQLDLGFGMYEMCPFPLSFMHACETSDQCKQTGCCAMHAFPGTRRWQRPCCVVSRLVTLARITGSCIKSKATRPESDDD
ncbi:uncharacterized protein LOC119444155 [Dermacentor silvarum]|uniref:uncharacterized protein LOC119444155 n=1 Tax=Dermacentor silvarum TaxID=543639 RepID=UPI0021014C19|nr:uncharacterized protein LOC119444155 [Dermacentor silvarum]